MKNKAIEETRAYLESEYGRESSDRICAAAYERLSGLMKENSGEPRAVRAHTDEDIFPGIALYEAMQSDGIEKEAALRFLDKTMSLRAEKKAQAMRSLCAHFGMYKLMPRIFTMVAKQSFGEAARFKAHYYDEGRYRSRFDMTQCLYCDTCRRYGCPELTKCFCHVDDVTDGNIHPRLVWARTKTMAEGGDCCDFDLYVSDEGGGKEK